MPSLKYLVLFITLVGFVMYLFIPAFAISFADNIDSSYILDYLLDSLNYATLGSSVFILSHPPIILSLVADDPDDSDNVYSVGDTITITFDSDTNTPGGMQIQSKAAVNDLYTFTESLGEAYAGQWIIPDTFVITISNATGSTPPMINYTTVTPAGITPILSYPQTSVPSTITSPTLSGDFGIIELFCGKPESYYNVIHGTNQTDRLKGTASADLIFGYDGDDSILGKAGDDCIYAGNGDDRIHAGRGSDTIHGGIGNDRIYGGSGINYLYGGDGNDYIKGGNGNDHIFGGIGNDRIYGQGGNDTIDGGAGDDYISGGRGADVIIGGTGDDWCRQDSSDTYDSCEIHHR